MKHADKVAEFFRTAQSRLVQEFENLDGAATFKVRRWKKDDLGAGSSRVLENGKVLERAGVNVSLVHGASLPASGAPGRPDLHGLPFTATALSLVAHPVNPYAPGCHANFRYFEVGDEWWFGGGVDMSPSYGFDEDAVHLHRTLKDFSDRYDKDFYPEWKKSCDEYFYLEHRGEMRGMGGIRFSRLDAGHAPWGECFRMVQDGADAILLAFLPILRRRSQNVYGERQRDWQLLRRGRYVEFNLIYDKGTIFGLRTRGDIEAILMSMPPLAQWRTDVHPEAGSPESDLGRFLRPHDWASATDAIAGELAQSINVGASE